MISLVLNMCSPILLAFENVRLEGGKHLRSGTVVISHNGKEGVICGDGWGMEDGDVMCRMAGYP